MNSSLSFLSSTGKNFYRNSNGKAIQSSYGRKYRVNNGYKLKGNSQRKNLKMNTKIEKKALMN